MRSAGQRDHELFAELALQSVPLLEHRRDRRPRLGDPKPAPLRRAAISDQLAAVLRNLLSSGVDLGHHGRNGSVDPGSDVVRAHEIAEIARAEHQHHGVAVPVVLVRGDQKSSERGLPIAEQHLVRMQRTGRGCDSLIQQPGAKDSRVVALVESLDAKVELVDLTLHRGELRLLLVKHRAGLRGGHRDGAHRPQQDDDRRGYQTSAAAGSHVTQTAVRPAPRSAKRWRE